MRFRQTANAMFVSSLLYNTLTHQQIEALQELSPVGEELMNGRLRASQEEFNRLRKERNAALRHNTAKPEAVRNVNFWEDRLKGHRKKLVEIASFVGDPLA